MKKLALILILVVVGLGLSAQYQVINNGESGLSVRTKMNDMHSELYTDITLSQFSVDGISWHDDYASGDIYVRFSSNLGVTWSFAISNISEFTDISLTNGAARTINVEIADAGNSGDDLKVEAGSDDDGLGGGNLYLRGGGSIEFGNVILGSGDGFSALSILDSIYISNNTIGGVATPTRNDHATNKAYVDSKAGGVDSITYDDDLYFRIYLNGVVVDSTLINASKSVYSVTLPAGASVAARVAAAVEGVNYPSGWVLTADGLNLVVTHGESRWTANVTVKVNTSGTIRQQLLNTAAYSYYSDLSSNETKIFSLATVNKPIIIYLIFE